MISSIAADIVRIVLIQRSIQIDTLTNQAFTGKLLIINLIKTLERSLEPRNPGKPKFIVINLVKECTWRTFELVEFIII